MTAAARMMFLARGRGGNEMRGERGEEMRSERGNESRRGGNRSEYESREMNYSRMENGGGGRGGSNTENRGGGYENEMRRRRDSRGRFTRAGYDMEDDGEMEMRSETRHYPAFPPPVYRDRARMGGDDGEEMRNEQNRMRSRGGDRMRSEGNGEMRMIGFMRGDNMPKEYNGEYRAEFGVPEMHEADYMPGSEKKAGHGSFKQQRKMDMETATEWVEGLENADETRGPHWTIEQAKQLMKQKGIEGISLPEFWAVLNVMYSDYCKVFKRHGVGDKMDFYVDMAKAFIMDTDAAPGKVSRYFYSVVEGGE